MKKYFIDSSDYTYTPYSADGFSGQILLATPKNKRKPKLLIKHATPAAVCNEFVACNLAQLIRIPAPKAYLLRISPEEQSLFSSPYAVGIEYIKGLHPVDMESIRLQPPVDPKYFDYTEQYALAAMLMQEDRIQMGESTDGQIYGYDFAESFSLTDLAVAALLNQGSDMGTELMKHCLNRYRSFDFASACGHMLEHLQKEFGLDDVEYLHPTFHEPMLLYWHLPNKQLNAITQAIGQVFPLELEVYYEECFNALREKIAAYLPVAEHWRSTEKVWKALSKEFQQDLEDFKATIKKEYGSRGVRDFDDMVNTTVESFRKPDYPLDDLEALITAMMTAFLETKKDARQRYTPKIYRKA